MHNLIPHFIYEQYKDGKENGRFQAITLFLDISGFTTMTQSLMQHGKEGAEILAIIINRAFEPIINTIYDHNGFVAGFAGDSLTAIFPQNDSNTALSACDTALTITQTFLNQGSQSTKFGDFSLAIKQGLSAGEIEWGIVGLSDRKAYFFRGEAIEGCAQSEHQANAGDIVLDSQLHELLPAGEVSLAPINNDYVQLISSNQHIVVHPYYAPTKSKLPIATIFFPKKVWSMSQQGEFRDVATVFISFQGAPNLAMMNRFITQVMVLVDQFKGYFSELDFGDKGGILLLYFGAPVAHENDIKRALSFILALQTEWTDADLVWRSGITFGTVYAGYVGTPLRDKYTCMGNIVNFASRLTMKAEWGDVLVSKSMALDLGFDFVPLGKLPYKGFSQLVSTYRLKGKALTMQAFNQKIVGRDNELQQLLDFVRPLFAKNQSGVIFIYGEAGIGKSHLAYALEQDLGGGIRWVTGQSDPLLGQAFNPFIYFLKNYFGQAANATEVENKAIFEYRFQNLLTVLTHIPDSQQLHDELVRIRSVLGALVDLSWPDSLYEQLDAKGRYQNAMIAISVVLQAECRRQPVILKLEDGHWLDESSRELITAISRQTRDVPLLILITSRYADDGSLPVYMIDPTVSTLTLELMALTAVSIQQLAQSILDTPIDATLQSILMEKTQANPFFVQQIIYYLQENHLLQVKNTNGTIVTTIGADTFALPTNLNTLLVARLDRLTQQVKEVVQTAAVLGREFELRLLTQMLKRNITEEVALAEQKQVWLLLNELEYIFKHILLRDAAYEMQLRAQLQSLHHLAAVTAEQLYVATRPVYYGAIAYHYEAAYLLGQKEVYDQAHHYLSLAGQYALDKFEHPVAIDYFSRALALIDEDSLEQRYQLLLSREKAYGEQGNRPAQEQDLKQLAKDVSLFSLVEQAEIVLRQAKYYQAISDHEQAISYSQTAIILAHQSNKNIIIASNGHSVWGSTLLRQGQYPEAREQYQKGLQLAKEEGNQKQIANCLHGLGNVSYYQTDYSATTRYYEQALTIRREIGDRQREGGTLNNLGVVFMHQGDYISAIKYYTQALTLHRAVGNRYGEGLNLNNLGVLAAIQGDYRSAQSYYEQVLVAKEETGDRYGKGGILSNLGSIAADQENHTVAKRHFKQALAIQKETGDQRGIALIFHQLGAMALAEDDIQLAENYYQKALEIHTELQLAHYSVEDWAGLAKVKLAQNEKKEALQYGRYILDYLKEDSQLSGTIGAMRVFRFTWDVLTALGQIKDANWVLDLAGKMMQAYLNTNDDPTLQKTYLSQLHHKVLWSVWKKRIAKRGCVAKKSC